MTYEAIAGCAQIVAMTIFGTVMAGVLVYALRPGNKARFDAAARLPLVHDEDEDEGGKHNGRT
ncbi:cbb3-type cytochrome c oxidase subunit 3 [uncultured Hyphomicrobium sp.]|uniref:cbb3-type cytochrome c oxidase subunit 3 n=1 Tax=uncultured Hyphomicrobium sp. TaxID=194373 RepID=UPI0025D6B28B|nr:cbb3-type cytochrome c oxidase subunit 3 [uncultured Hyphomicrobium sp.]